jgi:hypothetical protein
VNLGRWIEGKQEIGEDKDRIPIAVAALRHELSSLERWDRGFEFHSIMDICVCVYSVFVLSCVQVAALKRADHSPKESYRLCKNDYETEEEAKTQQRTVESLMNEWLRTEYDE